MEKIFEIKILRDIEFNDVEFFDSNNVLNQLKKFTVEQIYDSNIDGTGDYTILYGVRHKWEENFLGLFGIREHSLYKIFTFFVSKDESQQAMKEFINTTIEDLEFAGYSIQDSRCHGEFTMTIENENPFNLPRTEAALSKWRRCYAVIQDLNAEYADTDELQVTPPTLKEYHDHIVQQLMIKYCTKTISRIKKAGDAGLLN